MFERACDGTCVTAQALQKLNDDLRHQLTEATRTMLALVDAKAYKQRYPSEKPALPVAEVEKEPDVWHNSMTMEEIQRAAEESDKLDRALKVTR